VNDQKPWNHGKKKSRQQKKKAANLQKETGRKPKKKLGGGLQTYRKKTQNLSKCSHQENERARQAEITRPRRASSIKPETEKQDEICGVEGTGKKKRTGDSSYWRGKTNKTLEGTELLFKKEEGRRRTNQTRKFGAEAF